MPNSRDVMDPVAYSRKDRRSNVFLDCPVFIRHPGLSRLQQVMSTAPRVPAQSRPWRPRDVLGARKRRPHHSFPAARARGLAPCPDAPDQTSTGAVDNHWGEGFGAAALGALINVAG